MDFPNNKVNNILDTDNWSDGLLVKDEKGDLKPLKLALKDNSVKVPSPISAVSEGNLAPKNANFVPLQNVMGNSKSKSELVFHPEDKEELDFFAQNILKDDSKKYSVEKIVDRIITKQGLDLDEKNKKIFVNILYNFFRNRKSAIITRELLTNSVLIKNKKMATETVDIILSVIKGIKNKIDAVGGLVVNQTELKAKENLATATVKKSPSSNLLSPMEISGQKLEKVSNNKDLLSAQDEVKAALGELEIPEEKLVSEIEEKSVLQPKILKTLSPEIKKPELGFSIPPMAQKITTSAIVEESKPIIKDTIKSEIKPNLEVKGNNEAPEKIDVSLPKVSRPNLNQIPKKPISDVVSPLREEKKPLVSLGQKGVLMGAVQELGSFDLIGFRRLGNSATERTQKIFDKINLLEQESYTKKAQGIAAWRESGVYKLYLQLGTESMIAGKEVADFIVERESQNQNTLSIEEFSAISDLNKQLRF